jgi:YVTN family beta-propeller protein
VAVTPNGKYAYVINSANGGSVSVINTATNTVTATVTVGSDPSGVAVTSNGEYAYVTNALGDSVSVISTATNTVTATIPHGQFGEPWGVAVTPNGEYAYVTNKISGTVAVISTGASTSPTATSTVAPTSTIPEFPGQLLAIMLVVSMSIVLSAVIIAKKRKT